MPIYEYLCKNCHHQFDLMQKFSDPVVTECPECHQSAVEKQISAAGFQLKGTGWYVTDFKDKPVPKNANNSKDEKSNAKPAEAKVADANPQKNTSSDKQSTKK